jgi:hypothetical protein
MPIRVTCPGCHTRFNVSDKFAGREGPCPKCKAKIRIPAKSDEVVIHAPAEAAPKDGKGVAISKPIFRQELVISPLLWTITIGTMVTLFALALIFRWQLTDKLHFPLWILAVGAIAVAIPAVYGAYGMLRDAELGSFLGQELWTRVLICAAIYAALWLMMPIAKYVLTDYNMTAWAIATALMIAIGGAAATAIFDFDYLMGVLHYGLYFGGTLLLRWIMGVGVFPGQLENEVKASAREAAAMAIQWLQTFI